MLPLEWVSAVNYMRCEAATSTQQKPNCCFSKQLGYCSCVTILPMLIQRMQYSKYLMDTAEVYSGAVPPTTTTAFFQLPWEG